MPPKKLDTDVSFEVITPSRGTVGLGARINLVPPFTLRCALWRLYLECRTDAGVSTCAFLQGRGAWAYGGTMETVVTLGR